ncbi:39S ribosomal protein L45, mitochondrial [Kappamyces sp. JEL0680]|nr:39S ribosomal protein L45, mitochondrial [Kappamyces sp. JEL0680]
MYIRMNEAVFSEQADGQLSEVCTEGMIAQLRAETKSVRKLGQIKWTSHGQVSRPRVVHVAQAQAQLPEGLQKIAQAIVQIHLSQSLAIYQGTRLVGGDPDKIQAPVEYIVLEKWIERQDEDWKIKGKIVPAPSEV